MQDNFDLAASKRKVMLIDDEFFIHDLVGEALDAFCDVISVETGDDALMAAQHWTPNLILVDVEMPGIDGYETCRRFKAMAATAGVPVIFLSGHDQIEDRLKGYEAGGEDYLTKPFNPVEFRTKIQNVLSMVEQRGELKSRVEDATQTAMTAMTSMGEMGLLLEVLKNFNTCLNCESLVDAMLAGLRLYELQGAVQIRTPDGKLTKTEQGMATPLEESVIDHMAKMERIMLFKNRMSITYEHVSLLVNNMPVGDADRCGRLRDHLAMLAEGANVRLQGILAMQESNRRGTAIEQTVIRISNALRDIDADQRQSQINTSLAVDEAMDQFDRVLLSVALSEAQEAYFSNTIKQGLDKILNSQSNAIDLQDKLTTIIRELKSALAK
ncbi:MAG: two component transcriptional regulator, winged helix family [Proteobacteria bacterium]|nr:two component transcriptional regulator, winged helix family [Pseudomonadota bacterium]